MSCPSCSTCNLQPSIVRLLIKIIKMFVWCHTYDKKAHVKPKNTSFSTWWSLEKGPLDNSWYATRIIPISQSFSQSLTHLSHSWCIPSGLVDAASTDLIHAERNKERETKCVCVSARVCMCVCVCVRLCTGWLYFWGPTKCTRKHFIMKCVNTSISQIFLDTIFPESTHSIIIFVCIKDSSSFCYKSVFCCLKPFLSLVQT